MITEYRSADWQDYIMDWRGDPHPTMEDLTDEVAEIDRALSALQSCGVLEHIEYDKEKFLSHRRAIREKFDIPWTGISPRMQRLLYSVNAIAQPDVMVAMGVFCGNTFISNAGASLGPGACYRASRLVGIEIIADEAERACRNIKTIDPKGQAEILAADGAVWLEEYDGLIDLLYIDANGSYEKIIKAAEGKLHNGSLVVAHNSVNQAAELSGYLLYVRDPAHSSVSINMIVDDQGLEISVWH